VFGVDYETEKAKQEAIWKEFRKKAKMKVARETASIMEQHRAMIPL